MKPAWRRDLFAAAVLATAAVAVHLVYWDRGLVLLDEGFVATVAETLSRGGALYRDAVSYVPPAAYELLGLVYRIAGASLRTGRALTVILVGIFAGALFALARVALTTSAATLATAFVILLTVWSYPQWHAFGYQQPGIVAMILAAALLVPAEVRRSTWRPLAAGLLAGAAASTKQTYALSAIVLAAFVLLDGIAGWRPGDPIRRTRSALLFVAGMVPVALIALIALVRSGTLSEFWIQSVLAPLSGNAYSGYVGLPPLLPLFAQDERVRQALVYYLPPLLLELRLPQILASPLHRDTAIVETTIKLVYHLPTFAVAAALLRLALTVLRRRGHSRGAAWSAIRGGTLLLAVDGALLLSTNRPLDWMHVSFVLPGTILVLVWLVAGGLRPRRAVLAALAGLLVLACVPTAGLLRDLRAANDAPLDLPRAGVLARPPDVRVLEDLVASIQRHSDVGEPVLVLPLQPLVYFLADRPLASRYLLVWPVEYRKDRDAEILAAIDRQNVRTLVHGMVNAPQLGTFATNAPELLAGLVERFRIAEIFGAERWGVSFARLERRPPLPDGSLVVGRSLDGATAARGTGGTVRPVPATEVARTTLWPFDHVLALSLTPGGTTELRLPLPASEPGALVVGYGMNPDRWVAEGSLPLDFEALLERDGATVPLFSDRRDPQARVADRIWPERRLAFDGRPATLVLRITAPAGSPADADLAGFTLPRLEPGSAAGG